MSLLNTELLSTISSPLKFFRAAAGKWIANSVVMGGPESWIRFNAAKTTKPYGDKTFTVVRTHEVLDDSVPPKRLPCYVDIRVRYKSHANVTAAMLNTLVNQTSEQLTTEHITELDRGIS